MCLGIASKANVGAGQAPSKDMLILKAISLGPRHGYGVLLRIQQISQDLAQRAKIYLRRWVCTG